MAAPPSPDPPLPPPPPLPRRISSPGQALRLLSTHCHSPRRLRQAHAHILRLGLARHPSILLSLLRRYVAFSDAHSAAAIFSLLPFPPPPFAWNVMIRALTLDDRPVEALVSYFNAMIAAGVLPDKFSIPFAVKACSSSSQFRKGMELHGLAIKCGLADDIFVQNSLLHFYLCCEGGDAISAHLLFVRMSQRNVVSWTTLVSGMISRGELDFARAMFDEMPLRRNVVTWTALIDAYARSGRPEEAFDLFHKMQVENIEPNEFTIVALLLASTELGSLELGRWVHCYAQQRGLDDGPFVGTALIDMYSRCGSLGEARKVFDQLPVKTLATWNSMIASSGVHGRGADAFGLFKDMESSGMVPDEITFRGVLLACIRAGMSREALELFHVMSEKYSLSPTHESCRHMAELMDETAESDKDDLRLLLRQLSVDTQQALLVACRACDAVVAEALLHSY